MNDAPPPARKRAPRRRRVPIRAALVLRPEPAGAQTAVALMARGVAVRRCPLFAVRARHWLAPDPAAYDALLITSANTLRHGGAALAALAALPVCAVGATTAAAAAQAGFTVALTGQSDAASLVQQARAMGLDRLLHLAGEDRKDLPGIDAITVYASEPWTLAAAALAPWPGHVALLHSPRAARAFVKHVEAGGLDRRDIAVAAISDAALAAAGDGWAARAVATAPRDDALVAAAVTLIDRGKGAADKPAG